MVMRIARHIRMTTIESFENRHGMVIANGLA
jgi:hypothetical protein